MEKNKNVRSNQASAKGLVSEARKNNQDATGKQWPRNTRRRELPNNFVSNHPKNERQTNNGNKQKTRINVDKRLRGGRGDGYQRGAVTTTSFGTGLDESDEAGAEFEAELNSVYLPGSKKQNLNHLLNFNYAPRDRIDSHLLARTGNNKHLYVKRTQYNKEQFLQANCQFVVNSNGDYMPYTCSSDLLVDWQLIEQIHMLNSTEEPQCPICLYHPVAAKMTRCGHVYCWPCILHYLALSEKKSWRKCPICFEAVHIGDLKSTIAKTHRNYSNGDTVTLRLMYRDKESLRVYRAGGECVKDTGTGRNPFFHYLSDAAEDVVHSKLLLARPMEILGIIDRERNELKCQLTSEGLDCPDSIFVQQALHLLEEREMHIKADIEATGSTLEVASHVSLDRQVSASLNVNAAEFMPSGAAACVDDDDCRHSEGAYSDDNLLVDDIGNLTIGDINITQELGGHSNSNRFFFYQADDGQQLYLHSINVRMLQSTYGSLERAPLVIDGRILQKEICSMSEDLRKRLKYLQHLPVSCHFEVVEIVLEQPLVSVQTMHKFQEEIDHRQTLRMRRARAEQKREKQIDLVNERQIGKIIHTSANIDVTSDQQFPTYCNSIEDPLLHPQLADSPPIPAAATSGPSFAKMLSSPNSSSVSNWPSLARPTKELNIFATTSSSTAGPTHRAQVNSYVARASNDIDSDDDEVNSEYAPPPTVCSESFGSAIAQALILNNCTSRGSKNKKKKNRNTVLFSMGGRTFDGN